MEKYFISITVLGFKSEEERQIHQLGGDLDDGSSYTKEVI